MERGQKYTYEEFLDIIKTLRSDHGCPWDREQTHESLRPCLMEEAAEVLAGIRIYEQTGNYENLREELGDLLLQVVMHAEIAKEEGIFTMEDVVSEVAEKMVRRHPHVFGDADVKSSGQVLQNWEEIKKQEKAGREQTDTPLKEIPVELPALTRAVKVLKKTDKLYEPGRDYAAAVEDLGAAVEELRQCRPEDYDAAVTDLIGKSLIALCDISRACKVSPEQVLTDKIEDIIDHFEDRNQTK